MSDDKTRDAVQGVKFSQFKKVGPSASKKLQVVGLRESDNVRADLTTDLVSTNSSVVFRDSKGRFKSRADVPELNNQLEVNRFLWGQIEKLLEEPEAPDLPEDRLPIYAEDEPTEYPYAEDDEPNELVADDQWYQVTDPTFDYDDPDPEGLDLFIWTEMDDGTFEWVLFEKEVPDGVVIIKGEAPDPEEDGVGNGSLWFDNSADVMQLFVWHTDSDAWISAAPPTTLEGRVSTGEATQAAIITQINESLQVQADILLKVGELEVQKGSVARYKVKGTEFAVATRSGELYVSSPDASQVVNISLAILDLDDNPTKPCHEDDIIEFDWADGGVARYQVVSGDHDGLVVTYLSGTHTFEADQELETYVYPQNKGTATVEYVDAQDDKLLGKTANNVVDNNFRISRSDGAIYFNTSGGDLVISRLKTPTSDHHAVNKAYVDAGTHPPTNKGDVPTTTKLWKYAEGRSKYDMHADEFTIDFQADANIDVILNPYINGRWWAPASTTNYSHAVGEQYATISDYQGAVALGFKARKWWFMQKGKNDAGTETYHNALQGDYLKLGWPEKYRLKDGHWYNLNFPSPFPLVKFPEDAHTADQDAFGIDNEPDPLPDDVTDMGEVMP